MKARLVFVKEAVTFPGCFPSEISLSEKRIKGLEMCKGEQGIELSIKGQKATVPWGNIDMVIWEEEEKKKK